jgi:hypothetical protein
MASRPASAATIAVATVLAAGCDPVFDVAGSFFPSWMLCLVVGAALAAVLRLVFFRVGLEPHLGPLPLVYGCLGALMTMVVWLAFFST